MFDSDDIDYSPGLLYRSLSESDLHNTASIPMHRATSLSRFLITPKKKPRSTSVASGKVLTSIENLRQIEEKEKHKAQLQKEKDERQAIREAKRSIKGIPACTFYIFLISVCVCDYTDKHYLIQIHDTKFFFI